MLVRLSRLAPGSITPNCPEALAAIRVQRRSGSPLRPTGLEILWLGTKRNWLKGTATSLRRVTESTTLSTTPSSVTSRSSIVAIHCPLSLKTGVSIQDSPAPGILPFLRRACGAGGRGSSVTLTRGGLCGDRGDEKGREPNNSGD